VKAETGEGKVATIEAGGRYAAGITKSTIPGARYGYFDFAGPADPGPVDVAVEYFDGGKGQIVFAYDSTEYSCTGCPPIELTGGQTWNLVVFRLKDAKFSGRCNGFDFRLGSAPDGFAVGAVAVVKAETENWK